MSVFDLATSAPRAASGPTTYSPLREALNDDTFGRLQLVRRDGDGAPFVVVTDERAEPCDVLNAVTRERHAINAQLRALDDTAQEDRADDHEDQRAALAASIKALPRVKAHTAAPVARALAAYAEADAEAAA